MGRSRYVCALVLSVICVMRVDAQNAGAQLRKLIAADQQNGPPDDWPDLSPGALKKREAADQAALNALHSIQREQLPFEDRTAWDLYEWLLNRRLEQFRLGLFATPLWFDDRYFPNAPILATANAFAGAPARKQEAFPKYVHQVIALLRQSIDRKMLPSREFVRNYEAGCPSRQTGSPAALQASAEFCDFLKQEYAPLCPASPSLKAWPEGDQVYRELARRYTSTDLTPRQVQNLAAGEIRRIHAEMSAVIARTGFKGSLAGFLDLVRTDHRFYFDKREELLAAYRTTMARIEPLVPTVVGFVPRKHVEVQGMDGRVAAMWHSAAAGRSGPEVLVALNDLQIRPKFEIIPLMLHEGTPGHDLQHAVADAVHADVRDPLAKFVVTAGAMAYAAYGEGWGLYAESLGREMALYNDPYDEFGMLRMELTRTVRVAVDTGINLQGWSLNEAKEYFMTQTGKPAGDVDSEIARTHFPGGQLAYKVGQYRLMQMRKETQEQLGSEFDLRKFNDAVLRWGPLPLDLLARKMKECLNEPSCRGDLARFTGKK
jgi:uncharacterized protein (DUF885 family)